MVATISARKSIVSAKSYFTHLAEDDYYLKAEELGQWLGKASTILGLKNNLVTQESFDHALSGRDPTSGDKLITQTKNRQCGWDICLSAPKSVSVLFATAINENHRNLILQAHVNAVKSTSQYIEQNFAQCRRGRGGKTKEKVSGLLISAFTHKTSRTLCPQLHSHLFIHNLAPRKDTKWGTIESWPLYRAQKKIGAMYRRQLHNELVMLNIPSHIHKDTIKIDGISRNVEMAFSNRRKQILEAVNKYGYAHNAEGFQKACLRTRASKQSVLLESLIKSWTQRAYEQGFKKELLNDIFMNIKKPKLHQNARGNSIVKMTFTALNTLKRAAQILIRRRTPSSNTIPQRTLQKASLMLQKLSNPLSKTRTIQNPRT